MKTQTLFIALIIILSSQHSFGQASIGQNSPITGTEYLGWDADTQFPLYIRHNNAKPIVFETDATERMRITGDGRLEVGDNIVSSNTTLANFYTGTFNSAVRANTFGSGPLNVGGLFEAGGGTQNYGVWGFASNNIAGSKNYGVAGIVCGAGFNYAVYGSVCDTLGAWAGYFDVTLRPYPYCKKPILALMPQ